MASYFDTWDEKIGSAAFSQQSKTHKWYIFGNQDFSVNLSYNFMGFVGSMRKSVQ